jgi:biopolymer transport protein ExbB
LLDLAHSLVALLAQTAPSGAAPAADSAASRTLLDYIHDGGTVSYILVVVSVVAVALLIRNLLALRASLLAPPFVFDELMRFARQRDVPGALAFCEARENQSLLSTVVGGGLERSASSPLGLMELREGMEQAGRHEVDGLHRMNDGVGIIAAVGPMLGLLGTVIGMIGAFSAISQLQGAARSSELARFMSMALVCTAEGLTIAIPCTIAFALFRRKIDRIAGIAAQDAEEIARAFLIERPAVPATPAAASSPRPQVAAR